MKISYCPWSILSSVHFNNNDENGIFSNNLVDLRNDFDRKYTSGDFAMH